MTQGIKKAVPVLQHQDGKAETGPASQAGPYLHQQSTTTPPPGQAVHIDDFLLPGQENAVPLKYLKELLHLDGRTVRLMIRAERLRGIPILADNVTGYYLPANEQEREHCVTSMKHRANEIIRAADAIEQARW